MEIIIYTTLVENICLLLSDFVNLRISSLPSLQGILRHCEEGRRGSFTAFRTGSAISPSSPRPVIPVQTGIHSVIARGRRRRSNLALRSFASLRMTTASLRMTTASLRMTTASLRMTKSLAMTENF